MDDRGLSKIEPLLRGFVRLMRSGLLWVVLGPVVAAQEPLDGPPEADSDAIELDSDSVIDRSFIPDPESSSAELESRGDLPSVAGAIRRRPLRTYRDGIYQKLTLSASVIPAMGSESDDFGLADFYAGLTLAVPWPSREAPLFFTPNYGQLSIDRGPTTDLPATLHYSTLDVSWFKRWNERYQSVISVSPGVFGDLRQGSPDPIRIQGMALVMCDWIPRRLMIGTGILYLDRDDIPMLPVIGFTYTPRDDWKLEVNVRRNRLARLMRVTPTSEDWGYLTFDWMGNTYAVVRTDGRPDYATLQDFRFMAGWEQKRDGGAGHRLEAGVAFGREVDFRDYGGDFTAEPSIVIQGVVIF
jgi:hypothetical protein